MDSQNTKDEINSMVGLIVQNAKKFSNITHMDPVVYSFEDLVAEGFVALAELLEEEKRKGPPPFRRSTLLVRKMKQRCLHIHEKLRCAKRKPGQNGNKIPLEDAIIFLPDRQARITLALAELFPAEQVKARELGKKFL